MSRKSKAIVQSSILAIAVGFMFYGVYRGEADMVFQKAVNICLECIGLG